MKRLLLFSLACLFLALAACTAAPAAEQAVEAGDKPLVTVYSAPT